RGVTRSTGPRGFFSPASAFALSPFCGWPLPAGCACLPPPLPSLPPPSARCALSAFSDFWPFAGLPALSSFSAIDLYSRALGTPHLAARVTLANELEPDPGRLAVLRIGQRQIGQVDGGFLADDAAFLLRRLLLVALDHVDAAHQRAAVGGTHLDHLAA